MLGKILFVLTVSIPVTGLVAWDPPAKASLVDQQLASASHASMSAAGLPTLMLATTGTAKSRPPSFSRCAVCHVDKKGQKPGFGPNLYGVVGTKAGAAAGYIFSPAMKKSGIIWNRQTLDAFLLSPQTEIKGTKMAFNGVKNAKERQEIVEYLLTLK